MIRNQKKHHIRRLFRSHSSGSNRILILVFFAVIAAVFIVGRLYFIQVMAFDKYQYIAENQHLLSATLNPERGEIFLREANDVYPVAVNRQLQMAYAVPKEIEDHGSAATSASEILGLEKSVVEEKFSDPEDMFEILKHKLTEEEVKKISDAKIKGLYLMPEYFRFYPASELASQVVGFVGSDGEKERGRYGVEASHDITLEGKKGNLIQEKDTRGGWISTGNREMNPAEDGADIVLTIDHTIQFEVEKILKETIELRQADSGTAVVMEPKTGKILAMANAPSFNPNEFGKVEDMSVFGNAAVGATYESGSVFKPITMAIAIDDGKVTPDTTYVDTGAVHEAGYQIRNSDNKSNGKQTMTQVLEKSLNTGVIFVEKLVGNKTFAEYVERFGFGEKTGVDLPGEISGNTNNLKNLKSDIQFFTASFGQGISMTPLQLVSAYAAIANGGMLMKPQIIDRMIYQDGSVEEMEPKQARQVIKKETADQIGKMLRSVVVNGHGKKADVPGYLVGGKTGTAQVPKKEGGGYDDALTIGSFAGFAPIDDPQFVVLVKIDNPKGVIWAETVAAPAFSKIMKFLLDYKKIEPTEEYDAKKLDKFYLENPGPTAPLVSPVVKEDDKSKNNKKKKN